MAEVGPVPKVEATEFLLRINEASGTHLGASHRCIRIQDRKLSMCSLANKAFARRMA